MSAATAQARGEASAENKIPDREPDRVVEMATSAEQAALYRLSGDYKYVVFIIPFSPFPSPIPTSLPRTKEANHHTSPITSPLHIDPAFATTAGFAAPILHGLCTLGLAARAVAAAYGRYASVKVRFAGPVVPGQTLVIAMWSVEEGRKVVFQTTVKETGKLALGGAGVVLV